MKSFFLKNIWSPYVQKQNLHNSYAFHVFFPWKHRPWEVILFIYFYLSLLSVISFWPLIEKLLFCVTVLSWTYELKSR